MSWRLKYVKTLLKLQNLSHELSLDLSDNTLDPNDRTIYLHNNQQQTSFTISDAPSTDTSQGETDANAVQNENIIRMETTDKSGNDDTRSTVN